MWSWLLLEEPNKFEIAFSRPRINEQKVSLDFWILNLGKWGKYGEKVNTIIYNLYIIWAHLYISNNLYLIVSYRCDMTHSDSSVKLIWETERLFWWLINSENSCQNFSWHN